MPRSIPRRARRRPVAIRLTPLMAALVAVWPLQASLAQRAARPAAPAGSTIPVPASVWRVQGSGPTTAPVVSTNAQGGRDLLVQQTSSRGIYQWSSFDIGAASSVRFDLPDSSSSALNRVIGASSASAIYGRLSSNGTVYLLNGAGILFGPGARVDVGSLVASTLNLVDDDYNAGLTNSLYGTAASFWRDAAGLGAALSGPGFVEVQAGAQIQASEGGRIFLFAEEVSSAGSLSAPGGQVALAAGEKVHLQDPTREKLYASEINTDIPALRGLLVEVDGNGQVSHAATGTISTARGNTTLVGQTVVHAGSISATTSVAENGSVLLLARSNVTTGYDTTGTLYKRAARGGTLTLAEGSRIDIQAQDQVGGQALTSTDSATFTTSRIELSGQTIALERNATLTAPGAIVRARAGTPDYNEDPLAARSAGSVDASARITLADGAVIDVAGTRNTELSVASRFITTEPLGSNDLKDAPLQKDGPLYTATVTFDVRRSVPILGDTSSYVLGLERSASERLSAGGQVRLESTGAVVAHQGSTIDVSGGQVRFNSAVVTPTMLVGADGARVSLNDASASQRWTAIDGIDAAYVTQSDGSRVLRQDRWGVVTQYSSSLNGRLEAGYTEGRAGGQLQVTAAQAVLDGTLTGRTTLGERQLAGTDARATDALFQLGRLSNGGSFGSATFAGTGVETDLRLTAGGAALDETFWADALLASLPGTSSVRAAALTEGGFGRITLATEGSLRSETGADLVVGPRATITLAARGAQGVRLGGDIVTPGGTVLVQTSERSTASGGNAAGDITVDAGVQLDVAGRLLNLYRDGSTVGTGGTATSGGTLRLKSAAGLHLGEDSRLDVSGGATVQSSGAISAAAAGTLELGTTALPGSSTLSGAAFDLQGTLAGWALEGAAGGTLTLRAAEITLAGTALSAALAPQDAAAGQLALDVGSLTGAGGRAAGFGTLNLDGQRQLTVLEDVAWTAQAHNRTVSASLRGRATGRTLDGLATGAAAVGTRRAVTLNLQSTGAATSTDGGVLTMADGARLAVEAGGAITLAAARTLTMDGTLQAPGGSVTLDKTGFSTDALSDAWGVLSLGEHSLIDVSGTVLTLPSTDGRRHGSVLGGGTVTLRTPILLWSPGSTILADGVSGTLEGSASTLYAGGARTVHANAGTLDITLKSEVLTGGTAQYGGGLLGGTFLARAAAAEGAAGGTFRLTLEGDGAALAEAGGATRTLTLHDGRATAAVDSARIDAVRAGGTAALSDLRGRAGVDATMLQDSGAAEVALRSSDTLTLSGAVRLDLDRRLVLDAPRLQADAQTTAVQLAAASVQLGSSAAYATQQAAPVTAAERRGTATLSVEAGTLDLIGRSAWAGFSALTLQADGDLRALGVVVGGSAPTGALTTQADLLLRGTQLYPGTDSRFTLDAGAGRLSLQPTAGSAGAATPLSAGGSLTLKAATIEQAGVLRAPSGTLSLQATDTLSLAAGSLSSVAGDGTVFWGRTTGGGSDWVLQGADDVRTTAPDKRIDLGARALVLAAAGDGQAAATVDLSAGGTLLAHEFIAGPGGSTDIFAGAAAGAFAIVPTVQGVAPVDPAILAETDATGNRAGIAYGRTVTLGDGVVDGLPGGTYAVLPARYALLPGAWLVRPAGSSLSAAWAARLDSRLSVAQADGSRLVAGRFGVAGTGEQSALPTALVVMSGTQARRASEILLTTADSHFADLASAAGQSTPRGSVDAGALNLSASQLTLGARLDFGTDTPTTADARTPRGGELNIAAPAITLSGDPLADAGDGSRLVIDIAQLRDSGAASILLGGTRAAATDGSGTRTVTVRSSDVQVAAGTVLDGGAVGDLSLVASQTVGLGSGVTLRLSGAGNGEDLALSGDGAALRLNNGSGQLQRSSVSGVQGRLTLGAGSTLAADRLELDATAGLDLAADSRLQARALVLSGSAIAIGDVDSPVSGALRLQGSLLQAASDARDLTLRGWNRLQIAAGSTLGGDGLGQLTLDTARLEWVA
ncbi:MAG: hypothetical protein RLY78_190, partial [Pseudomonadota bacterium]